MATSFSSSIYIWIAFYNYNINIYKRKIVDALPQNLKLAISGGIGLFIALVGFKSGGIIVANPATLISFGDFTNPATVLTIIGICITAILMAKMLKVLC